MLNSKQSRLLGIQSVPFTSKEIDVLTGAERYMKNILNLHLIHFVQTCFPNIDAPIIQKINLVWEYSIAAFHLKQMENRYQKEDPNEAFQLYAAQMYQLEAHRILGTLFPLEHHFWNTFYKRQESEQDKILLALDALYFNSTTKAHIPYQLLLQALKAICQARYLDPQNRRKHYQNAKRLLSDMSVSEFHVWLNHQMNT